MMRTPAQLKSHYEKWAKEHGLEIFHTLETEDLPSVIYGTEEDHGTASFQKLILKSGAPFLIMAIVDVAVELAAYQADPEWFAAHDEDYQSNLIFLRGKVNELVSLEVGYVYQGIYFYQYVESDWLEDYEMIQAICYSYDGHPDEDDTDNIDLGGLLN